MPKLSSEKNVTEKAPATNGKKNGGKKGTNGKKKGALSAADKKAVDGAAKPEEGLEVLYPHIDTKLFIVDPAMASPSYKDEEGNPAAIPFSRNEAKLLLGWEEL